MASRADLGSSVRPAAPSRGSGLDRFVVPNAKLFLRLARQAAREGDIEHACLGYRQCLATWHRANALTGGRWRLQEALADREYSDFLLGHEPETSTADAI